MAEKNSDQLKFGRRTFIKGGLAASALLALAGCKKSGPAGSGSNGKSGGTFRWYIADPKSIDPYNVQEGNGMVVAYNLFNGLVVWNFDKDQLDPLVAESWEVSDDSSEFTFKIRKGTKFHNGDEVDAEAFRRGWTRIVNPKTDKTPSAISYHISLVEGYDDLLAGKTDKLSGLSCPDKYTFKVKLSAPYSDFPIVCAHPALVPVPAVSLQDFKKFFEAPIGNGPFQMDGKWVSGQHIVIKRFDDYFGKKPSIDRIYFSIQKDIETAFREFQAGNLDVCDIPTGQLKATIKKYGEAEDKNHFTATPKHQVIDGSFPNVYYLFFNWKDPQFADPDVRRALSLAINRDFICDTLLEGQRTPAANIVPPSINGYEKGAWKYSHFDRDAANKLLDKKYPRGANGMRNLSFTITYNLDGSHKQIIAAAIADWKAIGVSVKSTTKDWTTCLSDYQDHKAQAGRLGWAADYPIIDNFLYPMFYSKADDNVTGFNVPAVDEAILAARKIIDPKKRIAAYQAVNRQIGDLAPCAPIMFYRFSKVTSDKVKKFTLRPDGSVDGNQIEMV